MLKNLCLYFILIVLTLPTYSYHSNPCPPCNGTASDEVIYTYLDGCYYLIHYKKIECSDNTREIIIGNIEAPDGCVIISHEQMIRKAIEQILYESCMLFNVPDPYVPYAIRIKTPSCYSILLKENSPNNFIYGGIGYCAECCVTDFLIQLIGNQVVLQSRTSVQGVTGGCPSNGNKNQTPQGNPPVEEWCYPVCVSHNIPNGPIFSTYSAPECEFFCIAIPPGYNTPWESSPQYILNGTIGGCQYTFAYEKQICNGANTLRITRIVLNGNCQLSTEQIFQSALKKLISEGNSIFNLPSTYQIKIKDSECWKRLGDLIIPCNTQGCCWYRYNVITENDIKQLAIDANREGQTAMENCTSFDCESMCQVHSLLASTVLPKIRASISFENNNGSIEKSISDYLVKNLDDFNFLLESQYSKDCALNIIDIIGNKNSFSISKESVRNLVALPNGLYMYYITCNSETIQKGKIIINK